MRKIKGKNLVCVMCGRPVNPKKEKREIKKRKNYPFGRNSRAKISYIHKACLIRRKNV